MVKLAVVGASGLLGQDLCRQLRDGYDVTGTFHSHPFRMGRVRAVPLDVTSPREVDRMVAEVGPEVIVHCSAMTAVDGCEEDPGAADLLNRQAVADLVSSLEGTPTKLVHVSTDYVFDGSKRGRYLEDDAADPISVYGRTKLAGERAALERPGTLVLRVSSLWGPDPREGRRSFVSWVLHLLGSNEPVRLFEDQWVTPTYTGAVAAVLPEMLRRDLEGVYHLASSDCLTRLDCGRVLVEASGGDPALLSPVAMADAHMAAARPVRCCLDTGKIAVDIGREMNRFSDDVKDYLGRVLQDRGRGKQEEEGR